MKIGIITIIDCINYGNRLQNYAVQQYINHNDMVTINNNTCLLDEIYKRFIIFIKSFGFKYEGGRYKNFVLFNKNVKFSRRVYFKNSNLNFLNNYDYLIVGSDQVWNPSFGRLNDLELLSFVDGSKRIAFSASFGINDIPEDMKEKVGEELKKFKAPSHMLATMKYLSVKSTKANRYRLFQCFPVAIGKLREIVEILRYYF